MEQGFSKPTTANTGEENKVIAITGTSSGIGKATGERFEKEGWKVIRLPKDILDVRNVQTIQTLQLPLLDVFVNNAGIMLLDDFEKTTLEDWENTINTNLRGPFFLCQKVIPLIKDKGHLINIVSISASFPDREFASYNISKAGLLMLTQCLSKRYGNRIFINSISPGFVNTNLTADIEPTPQRLIDDVPMGRQAEPEEVADLIWYIVHNRYFNGSDIKFDGGLLTKHYGP